MDIQILEDFEVEGREVFNTHLAIATSTGAKVLHTCHRIYIDDNDGEWLHVVALSILGFFFSIIYSANAWIHTIAIYANTWYISSYI